jgi:hypothetical protein
MLLAYAKKSSPGFLEVSIPVMTTRFVSGACLQAPASNSARERYKSRFMIGSLGNARYTDQFWVKIKNEIKPNYLHWLSGKKTLYIPVYRGFCF